MSGRGSTDAAALIIGFTIQGLAIARALSGAGVKVYAIERAGESPAFRTRHATLFFYENLLGAQLIDALEDCRARIPERDVVLFAATDNTVAAIAAHWARLERHYLLSWADCRAEIGRIIQKGQLPAYCDATGTLYPKTAVISSEADADECAERLSFPVLVKPNKPASSFKTHIAPDPAYLKGFVLRERENWPLVAQEWIEGPDSSLYFYSCYLDHGREVFGMTGRKVRASPPGMGRATVIESVDDEGVRAAARRLMQAFPISGPVAMEFKRDSSGRYWFIEANVGRTEYCIDLPIQAGFNVPYMDFRRAVGLELLPPEGELKHSIWFDTEKEPFCYLAVCARHLTLKPFGKQLVFPYFGHREPGLVMRAALSTMAYVVSRSARKIRARLEPKALKRIPLGQE